ncbi:N-terminal methylation domain-containing protein [Campylobacter geochelonis]|uniref:N-terminal methylation domain-containing protein n=2 Tax=Campylobacter geochelonis TaxID=1780362 RepID=A0A128ECH4_9BACT|nr:N-terminal methylation domain-containing protein [Campylobacter geochelonis]
MAAGKKCLSVKVVPYDAGTAKPATLTVTAGGTGESICDKIHAMPSIKKILDGKYTYQAIKTAATSTKEATYESKDSEKGEIAISGLGVVY